MRLLLPVSAAFASGCVGYSWALHEWAMLGLCLVGAVILTLAAAGEGDTRP